MAVLLALLGFAKSEDQAKYPPAVAWGLLVLASYYAATIIEWAAWLMPVASVYFRTIGVLAVALLAHGMYRAVFHRDALSWSGWMRERVK